MLVLSRKVGERVIIRDDIEVIVLDVRGDRIRLGFDAPNDVKIRRNELTPHSEESKPSRLST